MYEKMNYSSLHLQAFLSVLTIFWLMLIGFSGSQEEPAYKDLVYGGAWKHVMINPSKKYSDVQHVEEKLLEYFYGSELFVGAKVETVGCYISISLLYSLSDTEPLLFTKESVSSDGSLYYISIPIPLGSTFFCEMKTKQGQDFYQHYITITKLYNEEDPIMYIYSHIFSTFRQGNLNLLLSLNNHCKHSSNKSRHYILSSLVKRKDLYSQTCHVKELLSKTMPCERVTTTCYDDSKNGTDKLSPSLLQMKVMTYNIWNFNPYHDDRLYLGRRNRLVQLLTSAKPDILGLQEVRFEASRGAVLGPSQMDHLVLQLKRYQYVFQPAQVFDSSLKHGRAEEGVAILSKYPIVYHDYLLLYRNKSNSADGHQRICLHAVVSVPGIGLVHVFNTHYSLSHEARLEASRQILEFMNMHDGPALLLGDLNATPEEESIKMLLKAETNLVDLWTELHSHQELGYTFSTLEKTLSKRIDYIFMRNLPGVEPIDIKVLEDNPRLNICSDHRAVQVTISFKACN